VRRILAEARREESETSGALSYVRDLPRPVYSIFIMVFPSQAKDFNRGGPDRGVMARGRHRRLSPRSGEATAWPFVNSRRRALDKIGAPEFGPRCSCRPSVRTRIRRSGRRRRMPCGMSRFPRVAEALVDALGRDRSWGSSHKGVRLAGDCRATAGCGASHRRAADRYELRRSESGGFRIDGATNRSSVPHVDGRVGPNDVSEYVARIGGLGVGTFGDVRAVPALMGAVQRTPTQMSAQEPGVAGTDP